VGDFVSRETAGLLRESGRRRIAPRALAVEISRARMERVQRSFNGAGPKGAIAALAFAFHSRGWIPAPVTARIARAYCERALPACCV
jgi:hypothetical protein